MTCNTTNAVSFGNPGKNGTSSYIYVAYADDVVAGSPDVVTNFTYGTPQSTTKWIAVKNSNLQLTNPVESDFQNLWVQVAGVGISPDTNIYNTDGTLEGNRTVDADGNSLTFTNIIGLYVNGVAYPVIDGTTGQLLATDGAGNITFVDPTNIYTSNGTLTSHRIVTGDDTYSLTLQNFTDLTLSTQGSLVITNTSSPSTAILLEQDLIQFNTGGGSWYSYGDDFTVLANGDMLLDANTMGRFGTSAGGVVARVTAAAGIIAINVTNELVIQLNGVTLYKLPLTTPTTGQVLTALDNVGTLGWV
jgi:hypothetical protein